MRFLLENCWFFRSTQYDQNGQSAAKSIAKVKMSLTALPEEVLEAILLHVNVEDILNVLAVVWIRGSERFWRKVCMKNGYSKLHEDDAWECVFHRNINWVKGCFVEHKYNSKDLSEDSFNRNAIINSDSKFTRNPTTSNCLSTSSQGSKQSVFLKGNKLLYQKPDGLLIMDVKNPKKVLQNLPGVNVDWCNNSGTKLLVSTSNSLTVYSCANYEEMFVWNNDCRSALYFLTNHYFVALETTQKFMTVVNFSIMEEYFKVCCSNKGKPFCVYVYDQIVNLVWLDGHKYVLRRYDLQRRDWLVEVELFNGATMIQVPQIQINQRVLAGWSTALDQGSTTLKIWTSQDYKNPIFTCISSKFHNKSEHILWLLLDTGYVIYSTSKSLFFIMQASEPNNPPMSMTKPESGYLGQNIVAGLLLLSYTNCFKLVNFKNATYLYQISFTSGYEFDQFCVNENYYIVYNSREDQGNCKLCVHDFRGKLLTC